MLMGLDIDPQFSFDWLFLLRYRQAVKTFAVVASGVNYSHTAEAWLTSCIIDTGESCYTSKNEASL